MNSDESKLEWLRERLPSGASAGWSGMTTVSDGSRTIFVRAPNGKTHITDNVQAALEFAREGEERGLTHKTRVSNDKIIDPKDERVVAVTRGGVTDAVTINQDNEVVENETVPEAARGMPAGSGPSTTSESSMDTSSSSSSSSSPPTTSSSSMMPDLSGTLVALVVLLVGGAYALFGGGD